MSETVQYERGEEIHSGKTKTVFAVKGHPDKVICENRNDITADDDPGKTRQFATKAAYATTTTCRVFELLRACGIPVAYIQQLSPTSFLAYRSNMVKLEVVGRRLAFGSYLKRRPDLKRKERAHTRRFHRLVFELFLKTTGQVWEGRTLPCEDPWIIDPYAAIWQLAAPKIPLWDDKAQEGFFTVDPKSVLGGIEVAYVENLLRDLFLVLELAWSLLAHLLVDIKIEIDDQGRVSDVVDNDSWRLWGPDGEEMDKQVFRDFGDSRIKEIEEKYGTIARLSERLRLPKQALVYWRASETDPLPKIPTIPGVQVVNITGSGHKQTVSRLGQFEGIVRDFPEGGVVAIDVGRSDGLGPVVAAHSPWPTIATCASYEKFPPDIHSSLRLPSAVPLLSTWDNNNAVLAALTILGQKNPAAYAYTQKIREAQDDYGSN